MQQKVLLPMFFWFVLTTTSTTFGILTTPQAAQTQWEKSPFRARVQVETIENFIWNNRTMTRALAQVLLVHHESCEHTRPCPKTGEHFSFVTFGGRDGSITERWSGYPLPEKNKVYDVALNSDAEGQWHVTGFDLGLKEVTDDETENHPARFFTRNRIDGSNGEGEGAFLYWANRSLPIPYYLHYDSFKNRENFADAVDASFSSWSQRPDTKLGFLAMGCTSQSLNQNDGVNAVIFEKTNWGFDSAAIAITRNFFLSEEQGNAGEIVDTDILLNEVDYRFSSTGEMLKHDLQNILTHEAGHFIGFGHEPVTGDSDSVMYPTAQPGEFNKRSLKPTDFVGLYEAYAGTLGPVTKTTSKSLCQLNVEASSCLSVSPRSARTTSVPFFTVFTVLVAMFLGRKYAHHRQNET